MITFPEVCKSARTHTVCVCVLKKCMGGRLFLFVGGKTRQQHRHLLCFACVCVCVCLMPEWQIIHWPESGPTLKGIRLWFTEEPSGEIKRESGWKKGSKRGEGLAQYENIDGPLKVYMNKT